MVAPDAATTASESTISGNVFGNSGHNLKSQYAACSYGKLQFEKATDTANKIGNDGVHTLSISMNVIGASDDTVRTAVVTAGDAEFGGSLQGVANYVMLCLPPGTSGGWIAYAYVNSWLSVYNDEWCGYLSGQMHEVGKCPSFSPIFLN